MGVGKQSGAVPTTTQAADVNHVPVYPKIRVYVVVYYTSLNRRPYHGSFKPIDFIVAEEQQPRSCISNIGSYSFLLPSI